MLNRTSITTVIISLVLGATAVAQNAAPATTTSTKTKSGSGRVELNFENELIEGAVEKPDLEMYKNQIPQRFKRLLKFRESFNDEAQKGQVQFDRNP